MPTFLCIIYSRNKYSKYNINITKIDLKMLINVLIEIFTQNIDFSVATLLGVYIIYTHTNIFLYIYVCAYISICMCVYIYKYIYIYVWFGFLVGYFMPMPSL